MIANSLDGLDLRVLVFVDKEHKKISPVTFDKVKGLLIFNQVSSAIKLLDGKNQVKIMIHHFSCINESLD